MLFPCALEVIPMQTEGHSDVTRHMFGSVAFYIVNGGCYENPWKEKLIRSALPFVSVAVRLFRSYEVCKCL